MIFVFSDFCGDHVFHLAARTSRKMANKVPDPMIIIVAERMILGTVRLFSEKDMRWASCPNTKVIRKGIRRNLFWMPFLIQNMPWYEELLLAQIIYIFLEDYFVLEGN